MTHPTLEERQKTAATELSSLGRVSHRLALIDSSERLQQVLEKLLPRLLRRIGENHQQQLELEINPIESSIFLQLKDTHGKIHAKLVEMLSHTMKRVRDDQLCKLPCKEVLQLLLLEEENTSASDGNVILKANVLVDPFTLNLALAFITLGIPRCSTREDVEALLPSLLVLVGQFSGLASIRTPAKRMQSHQVGHLLLRAIEWLVQDDNKLAQSTYSTLKATSKSLKKDDSLEKESDNMTVARAVLDRDESAAGAVWDFLLDGILYQPVAGDVPPNGLSQAGHERLKSGNSSTSRDWAAEKAPSMKLMEFKVAILDFIAPSRRWAIFAAGSSDLSVSRTVALLVVASGDPNPEVAQRASTYLKMHHDSFRGSTNRHPKGSVESSVETNMAVGDPVRLACGLLSLALGQTNAESAMMKLSTKTTSAWLGLAPDDASSSDSSQLMLSLKRRSILESTAATIIKYVTDKILEENPHVFHHAQDVLQMSTLSVLATQRTLSHLRTSSGFSVLQAKPYVAAAQLLNVLCVRVSAFYDSLAEETSNVDPLEKMAMLTLMARALATACAVLAPASSPISNANATAVVSNDGSIAIRDSCYGVLCSLCRSHFILAPESYIFTRGFLLQASTGVAYVVSIDTASLLFGCASNEIEILRPRAVAALDALLGAYRRVFLVNKDSNPTGPEPQGDSEAAAPSNPWATTNSDDTLSKPCNGRKNLQRDTQNMVKSLLPLLWSASQTSQAKASRVAAARWTSDLIKEIDITSASHLLCFLAGDPDVTASSIAREGLGIPSKLSIASATEEDFSSENTATADNQLLPDFGDYVSLVFPSKRDSRERSSSDFWRPQYWDMSFAGKAAALRFGLVCLLSDIYGGEKGAEKVFFSTLADTLILFGSKADGMMEGFKVQGREAIDC
jgi:proteasome component ECM29